jgi:glycerol-3-phosphate acyltransferase PlsX
MSKPVRIALDAMGGDFGPEVVIPGAALALERRPDSSFIFFGKEATVRPLLDAHPRLAACSTLKHTDVAVQMHEKPTQALRTGRRTSSMWMALEAVKAGEADCASRPAIPAR